MRRWQPCVGFAPSDACSGHILEPDDDVWVRAESFRRAELPRVARLSHCGKTQGRLARRGRPLDSCRLADTIALSVADGGCQLAGFARLNVQHGEASMNGSKVSKLAGSALVMVALGGLGLRAASAEPQPRMESALRHLQEAREELRRASADKGGHREQAIEFTVKAIRQVEEGIQFDNRHREPHEPHERR